MRRRLHIALALSAVLVPAAIVGGCGGVPGNAVAQVDGESIEKSQFDHWLQVAAKSGGQSGAQLPKPPEFAACVAQKRKTQPKPGKGQPKVTDTQLKEQCKQEYESLRDQVLQFLISAEWIQNEAGRQGVKVTDAEVRKRFEETKKQNFPKAKDYEKFLKDSGMTENDILLRVRLDLLSNKIREKVTKGKDKVTEQQIGDYYEKNKQRFAQPERRDVRIVLTKKEDRARQAKRALAGGDAWKQVARRYSVDQASKAQGGKLAGVAKGQQEKALDDAIFKAKKGELSGPVKTQFGFYVFEVTKVSPASQQSLKEATPTIKQLLAQQNQQKALDDFVKDFRERWKEATECREGFVVQDCSNAPKPKTTGTAPPGGVPNQGQGQGQGPGGQGQGQGGQPQR